MASVEAVTETDECSLKAAQASVDAVEASV